MDETFVNNLATALRKVGTIHTVGEEWVSYIGEIPVGGVPYCGQMVTRATYSALWAYAQEKGLVKTESEWQQIANANNGNVPYYSDGDGSTTFRMPKLVGYVKGASSQSVAGDYIAEGLPNITGYGYDYCSNDNLKSSVGGAVTMVQVSESRAVAYWGNSNTLANTPSMGIDASKSNSIYGNSDHVTPETSTVMFGVYAFGAIIETGALDATTLAQAVARVESNMLTKIPTASSSTMGGIKPTGSWRKILTDSSVSTYSYTAEKNCFIVAFNNGGTTNMYVMASVGGIVIFYDYGHHNNGYNSYPMLFLRKGQTITYTQNESTLNVSVLDLE